MSSPPPPSAVPGATRTRAWRQRRAKGERCATVTLRDVEVRRLVLLGLLPPTDADSPAAVQSALHRLLDVTLGDPRWRP